MPSETPNHAAPASWEIEPLCRGGLSTAERVCASAGGELALAAAAGGEAPPDGGGDGGGDGSISVALRTAVGATSGEVVGAGGDTSVSVSLRTLDAAAPADGEAVVWLGGGSAVDVFGANGLPLRTSLGAKGLHGEPPPPARWGVQQATPALAAATAVGGLRFASSTSLASPKGFRDLVRTPCQDGHPRLVLQDTPPVHSKRARRESLSAAALGTAAREGDCDLVLAGKEKGSSLPST